MPVRFDNVHLNGLGLYLPGPPIGNDAMVVILKKLGFTCRDDAPGKPSSARVLGPAIAS